MSVLPPAGPAARRTSTGTPAVLAVLAVGAYLLGFSWAAVSRSYDVWGAFLVAPVLVLVSIPMLRAAARRVDAPWFARIALIALLLKLVAGVARYLVAFVVYGGVADAAGYHGWGTRLAEEYASGNFGAEIGRDFVGTGFIRVLTGIIYVFTGPGLIGGYLVYAWIGFWGLILAIMAFRVAIPDGDLRRYALLVLFLPSLLFWPSGMGKEAWMIFGIGLSLYGAALLLRTGRRGAVLLALGLAATAVVRPHVTVMLATGLLAAVLLRPSRTVTPLTPLLKGGGLLVALAVTLVAVVQAASFLGVDDLSSEGLQQQFDFRTGQTAQGGSSFEGAAVTSPLDLPWATTTVIFRPFPWEAGGALPLLSSLEGVLLLGLAFLSRRRILRVPTMLRSHPYLALCLTFILLYVVVFSGFSNFGILVRQRSLVLPAFLVFLALPEARPRPQRRPTATTEVLRR